MLSQTPIVTEFYTEPLGFIKMKYNIYLILIVLATSLPFSLYGQDIESSLILKNKVKAIYEVSWNVQNDMLVDADTIGYRIYSDSFKLIEEYSKTYPFKYKYTYDSNGLLIKKIKLDNQNDKKIEIEWEFEYDKDEKLIREVSYWADFKGKHPISYSYNEKNQLTNTSHLNNNNEVYKSLNQKYYETGEEYERKYEEKYNKSAFKTERFDKCGNLIYLFRNGKQDSLQINHTSLSLCPDLLDKESYLIDTLFVESEKGKLIRYTFEDKNRKSIYSNDSLGHLINVAKYQFKPDGSINQSVEESYNEEGKLTEYQKFYHWKMDNYSSEINIGRIHKKLEYYQNGILFKIYYLDKSELVYKLTEYKIEYKE